MIARKHMSAAARQALQIRKQSQLSKPSVTAQKPNYEYKFLQEPATAAIIPCPFNGGQGRAGVELGPNRLIQAGLPSQLSELGWNVQYDEIPSSSFAPSIKEDKDIGNMKKPRLVSEVCKNVSKQVEEVARRGWLPVTLGGDHSLGMGTVSGTKAVYPNAGFIWVDAHADINTPETTDTGNLHGCPVSFLLGLSGTNVSPFNSWLKPCLKPSDIVYIGLRDVDPSEKLILRQQGIKTFTMHEIDKYGIGKIMEMTLDHLSASSSSDKPIHLSFDVDALDPEVAPSTGTPVRGGLTFREGHYITEAVAETGNLVALDIMEVNPSLLDQMSAEQTVRVGCSLARAALGETLML